MGNLYKLTVRETIENEAATWLIRLDREQPLDADEKQAFTEWLNRSPAHRQELVEQNKFWSNHDLTKMLLPKAEEIKQSQSDTAKQSFWQRLIPMPAKQVALTMFTVTAIGLLSLVLPNDTLLETNGVYATVIGEQKTQELADGSVIELNTNSEVEVKFDDEFRNIRLVKGEAHFIVAKNKDKPFRVYAKQGRVQAVGTEFSIKINPDEIGVLVTEGRVALAALAQQSTQAAKTALTGIKPDPFVKGFSKQMTLLDAGQRAVLKPFDSFKSLTSESVSIDNLSDQDYMQEGQAWRDGWLVFSGESLEQVVNEIRRYSPVTIDIVEPEIKQLSIGGRFKIGDIDGVMLALENNFGIKVVKISSSHIELSKAP